MDPLEIDNQLLLVTEIPTGYTIGYERFYYNLPQFLALRTDHPSRSYYLCSQEKRSVLAEITFFFDQGVARSGAFAPFGSFDLSPSLTQKNLNQATYCIKEDLIKGSVKRILIHHYPGFYNPAGYPKVESAVGSAGFEIVKRQLNHHLEKNQSFDQGLHQMEKRKLTAIQIESPLFKHEPLSNLPEVFGFIDSCRKQRSQTVSLSLEELAKMAKRFPSNYHLFTLRIGDELAAASICVMVNKSIMYNFYPAFATKFSRLSPLVYLIREIHYYCQNQAISILDLGTSEVDGKSNDSLSQFKDRIGGSGSFKYSFEWSRGTDTVL